MNGIQSTWFKPNLTFVSLIVSTALILGTFLVAWGSVENQVIELDRRMLVAETAITLHHEDLGRHVDQTWKDQITAQLTEIRRIMMEERILTVQTVKK